MNEKEDTKELAKFAELGMKFADMIDILWRWKEPNAYARYSFVSSFFGAIYVMVGTVRTWKPFFIMREKREITIKVIRRYP